ncbi:MAG: HEPN domain-containing protein [Candidatus Coatesbacteria bacterium]
MSPAEQAARFLKKAAEDEAVLDLILASDKVSDDVVGFHAQQAAEKLLKALLSHLGLPFRRTHDLRGLIEVLEQGKCPVPEALVGIDELTPYGTLYRYEDLDGSPAFDRNRSRGMVRDLRLWVEARMQGPASAPENLKI